jgi:hypothetical protein
MKTNPLLGLNSLGQSVWLDYLSRDAIRSGALKRLVIQSFDLLMKALEEAYASALDRRLAD